MATLNNIGLGLRNGGRYLNYQENGVDILQLGVFVEVRAWQEFVHAIRTKNFAIQTERERCFALLDQLRTDAPFDMRTRFPEEESFITFSPEGASLIAQLTSSLAYKDRSGEVGRDLAEVRAGRVQGAGPSGQNPAGNASDNGDKTRAQQDALVAFYKGITGLDTAVKVVNRITFERANHMVWENPPPRPQP